jgi:hypothetical protein
MLKRSLITALTAISVTCVAPGCAGSGSDEHRIVPTDVGGNSAAQPFSTPVSVPPPSDNALFSSPQPWTMDVSGFEKSERSDAIIDTLRAAGGWGTEGRLQIDFSLPVLFADSDARRMDVVGTPGYCYEGNACDSVPARMPVPDGAYVEGSTDLSCDPSGNTEGQSDCHLLVVDRAERKLYETYNTTQDGDVITTLAFFVWDLGKEYPADLRGDQCTSADAAGFPITAMTPTADEVASGSIDHALRFILPNDRMKAGVYVRPATHAGGPDSSESDAPPYGVRFRLRADFDDSGFNDAQKVVIAALKKYGMLLADGGTVPLTFADDRNAETSWADLGIDAHSFDALAAEQFEVVDLGEEIPLTYDCVRND